MISLIMEAMAASAEGALAESLKLVDEADVYVGILGHRYGYVPKDHDKSITHLEYERAVEREIPVLMFFILEDHELSIRHVETGPGAEKLKRLQDEIGEERVVPFLKSPEDLRGQFLHALEAHKSDVEGERQPTARSFHSVSAIPAPPEPYIAHPYTLLQTTDLIGRRDELVHLTDRVTRPHPRPRRRSPR